MPRLVDHLKLVALSMLGTLYDVCGMGTEDSFHELGSGRNQSITVMKDQGTFVSRKYC
jgi:hypothetical protein